MQQTDARRRVTHRSKALPPPSSFAPTTIVPLVSTLLYTMQTVDMQQLKSGEVNLGVRVVPSSLAFVLTAR